MEVMRIRIGRKEEGRIPEKDERLFDDDYVSYYHCEIYKDDRGNCYIIDTDSRNGTYVDGCEISKQRERRLNKGEIVKIGSESHINWQKLLNVEYNTGELPPNDSTQGGKGKEKGRSINWNWKSVLGIVMTIMSLIMMLFMLLRMLSQK